MDVIKIGALIAQARRESGLTQKELGQALHVSAQAVSKWERGLNLPDLALIEPLAELLGLTVTELLAGERGQQPQESLVRDTLRTLLLQMGGKVRRWRWLFCAALALLLAVLAGAGYLWVRDNTDWLPQRTSIIVPREPTDSERLAASAAGSLQLCLFDLTIADQVEKVSVWLEEWTEEGLLWSREISSEDSLAPYPRHQILALSWQSGWDADALTLDIHMALSATGTLVSSYNTFHYHTGYAMGSLTGPTVISPERGAVLACFSLDPTGTYRWRAPSWTGDVDAPTVEEGEAFLLLRLRCG